MNARRSLLGAWGIALALLASLIHAAPLRAQTALIAASPPAASVLNNQPERVVLTFNCIVSNRGLEVKVGNEAGERVDLMDAHVDPANAFTVVVSLPPLPEGRYQVFYSVSCLGGSTTLASGYSFSIDLPDPSLEMLAPVNGDAFETPSVPLRLQVGYFDPSQPEDSVHLYVDGVLFARLDVVEYQIEGLAPGVHEIRAVLARLGEELPQTARTATIAIAQPDPESEGRELAALAPPDEGLRLTPLQWTLVAGVASLLLAFGVWLGRTV